MSGKFLPFSVSTVSSLYFGNNRIKLFTLFDFHFHRSENKTRGRHQRCDVNSGAVLDIHVRGSQPFLETRAAR